MSAEPYCAERSRPITLGSRTHEGFQCTRPMFHHLGLHWADIDGQRWQWVPGGVAFSVRPNGGAT